MTELELLVDFHKDAERQGPGSEADTLKALSFIDLDQDQPLKVADIGCGSGAQTITLAQQLKGHITAVDLFPEFLSKLAEKAKALGLQDQITTLEKSMDQLPFGQDEFDIVWSEGAAYIMGFEAAIQTWRDYLKTGGYLAVSEITWITHNRPKEIQSYWESQYAEIGTASHKIQQLEEHGYSPVGYFFLPQTSWLDHYYHPIEARFDDFLARHQHHELAQDIVKRERAEIEQYNAYKDYWSYGFYVARKV